MHDIIIEIREKVCVHVDHLEISTQSGNGNNGQPLYREYMKGSAPRSQRKKKEIK